MIIMIDGRPFARSKRTAIPDRTRATPSPICKGIVWHTSTSTFDKTELLSVINFHHHWHLFLDSWWTILPAREYKLYTVFIHVIFQIINCSQRLGFMDLFPRCFPLFLAHLSRSPSICSSFHPFTPNHGTSFLSFSYCHWIQNSTSLLQFTAFFSFFFFSRLRRSFSASEKKKRRWLAACQAAAKAKLFIASTLSAENFATSTKRRATSSTLRRSRAALCQRRLRSSRSKSKMTGRNLYKFCSLYFCIIIVWHDSCERISGQDSHKFLQMVSSFYEFSPRKLLKEISTQFKLI